MQIANQICTTYTNMITEENVCRLASYQLNYKTKYKNVLLHKLQFGSLPNPILPTNTSENGPENTDCKTSTRKIHTEIADYQTNCTLWRQRLVRPNKEWRTHSYVSFFFSFPEMPFAFLHQLLRVFFFFEMVLLNMTKMLG